MIKLATAAMTLAAAAGLALAGADAARAQALDVVQPEVAKGESEARIVNVFNGRYPPGTAGVPRSTHELSYATSPTDWINVTFHLELDNVLVDGWRADHVGLETVVPLLPINEAAGGLGLAWYTTLQVSTDPLSTNSLVFGPIAKLALPGGKGWFTVNPNLEDQFGRNSGPGLNLLYGWQVRWKLSDTWAIGVDGFGRIADIAHAPDVRDQDHRIGPAVYTELQLSSAHKLTIDTALLVGLTEASPDVSLKFNVGHPF